MFKFASFLPLCFHVRVDGNRDRAGEERPRERETVRERMRECGHSVKERDGREKEGSTSPWIPNNFIKQKAFCITNL